MDETGWAVLDEAHRALRETVAGLGSAELAMPTPCEQWNVTQVLQHAAGDQLGYASAITGEPGPTWDPFAPSGHLDEDASGLVERALQMSAAAWPRWATTTRTSQHRSPRAGWLRASAPERAPSTRPCTRGTWPWRPVGRHRSRRTWPVS